MIRSRSLGFLLSGWLTAALGPSPAVDTGSRDFLNGGTTSTDLAADNPPSTHGLLGDPDNMDSGGSLGPWDDSNKKLDLGYHYGAASQDSGTVFTTLRHPKERIPDPEEDVSPDVTKSYHLALAAGKDSNDNDQTVAVFKTTDVSKIGYRVFRGNSAAKGALPLDLLHVPVSVAVGAGASSGGTVYIAGSGWSDTYIQNDIYLAQERGISVYRLQPDGSWLGIGNWSDTDLLSSTSQPPDDIPNWPRMALAPKGDDLYVFWTDDVKNDFDNGVTVRGAYIAGAATGDFENGPINLANYGPPDPIVSVSMYGYGMSEWDGFAALEADWDLLVDTPLGGIPRILWVKSDGSQPPTPQVAAAQVLLNPDGTPYGSLGSEYTIDYGIKPSLAVNVYDSDRFGQLSLPAAFSRFIQASGANVNRSTLTVDANGDHWEIPGVPDPILAGGLDVSVTYRSFGTERVVATMDGVLFDTAGGPIPEAGPDHSFPKVRTNASRKENLYLAHQSGGSSIVDVYQIAP